MTATPDSAPTSHPIADDDRVPVLEPALWKQLGETQDLPTFCTVWLTLQCGLIGGVAGGAVVIGQQPTPIATWPQGFDTTPLAKVATLATEQRRGVAHYGAEPSSDDAAIAALAANPRVSEVDVAERAPPVAQTTSPRSRPPGLAYD